MGPAPRMDPIAVGILLEHDYRLLSVTKSRHTGRPFGRRPVELGELVPPAKAVRSAVCTALADEISEMGHDLGSAPCKFVAERISEDLFKIILK